MSVMDGDSLRDMLSFKGPTDSNYQRWRVLELLLEVLCQAFPKIGRTGVLVRDREDQRSINEPLQQSEARPTPGGQDVLAPQELMYAAR